MATSSVLASFSHALINAENIIVVAGAGLSAASGIPTFRGAGGLWRSLNAMSLATPEAFETNPSLVWQFYHYRRETAREAQPNDAHLALALLSIPSVLKKVAPKAKSYNLITQNVDGLSPRSIRFLRSKIQATAAEEDQPREGSIIEMHGRIFDVTCTECDARVENLEKPLCQALGEAEHHIHDVTDAGTTENDIPVEKLPRCSECGALGRPGVVWFGEMPLQLPEIDDLVKEADLCLVVGTSSTVWPAAGFASEVARNGGSVAIFDLNTKSLKSKSKIFKFAGPCEELLPLALGLKDEIEALRSK